MEFLQPYANRYTLKLKNKMITFATQKVFRLAIWTIYLTYLHF